MTNGDSSSSVEAVVAHCWGDADAILLPTAVCLFRRRDPSDPRNPTCVTATWVRAVCSIFVATIERILSFETLVMITIIVIGSP